MTDAAKRALLGIAQKNYLELVEKRKKEQEKERKEMERLKKEREKDGGSDEVE